MEKIQKIVRRILLLTSLSLLLSANAEAVLIANAGPDRTHIVTITNQAVHLVSIPTESEDEIVRYEWYKDGVYIGPHESRWHLLVEEGVYTFELRVYDSDNNMGSDTVEITVVNTIVPPEPFEGTAPTASNIFMTGIPKVGETLTLNYTFEDEDGDSEGESIIVWSTPTVELQRSTSKTYTIPAELEGELIGAYLHVIDENGVEMERTYDYAAANNTLTVLPSDAVLEPLTANAGDDKILNVTASNTAVHLMGTATDANNNVVSYKWYKGELFIGNGASRWHVLTENGEHEFRLVVEDADGNTAMDTMVVTVNNGVTPELTVDAGSDQTVVLSGSNTEVYLSGTATDTNNNIVSYKWYIGSTFIGDGASLWYTMNTVGTYALTLVVEDADGNVARDTMIVTVEE